jgi:hypothetical protein
LEKGEGGIFSPYPEFFLTKQIADYFIYFIFTCWELGVKSSLAES